MYRNGIKRVIDFSVALFLMVLFFPLMTMITVALFFVNRGSPFFFQARPGRHQRNIRIVKFRSMNNKRDSSGSLLPDNQRLTKFGSFIRKTSLDELPQLWNVLEGDMSLVGPRPLLYDYLPLYSDTQKRRHEVRPGITGWAQVNGRNSISWTEKFKHDVYYVDNVSFLLDLKILLLTVLKVSRREGINQSADRPMQRFTGSN